MNINFVAVQNICKVYTLYLTFTSFEFLPCWVDIFDVENIFHEDAGHFNFRFVQTRKELEEHVSIEYGGPSGSGRRLELVPLRWSCHVDNTSKTFVSLLDLRLYLLFFKAF